LASLLEGEIDQIGMRFLSLDLFPTSDARARIHLRDRPRGGGQRAASAGAASGPYGAPIAFEAAKKVMAAAEAEARKNNWSMAIAILDSTGHVVMLHRFDNTQYGSIAVAEDKARSALDQ
jgi:hypothetical protein